MEIFIIFILILLNGIFSMSEIALVSAKKFKLESAARKGNSHAQKALDLSENPNIFLSTVQIGITLIGILTGIYSGEKITVDVKTFFSNIPLLMPYADTLSVTVVLIILTFFSIVLGELIPKRIGLMFPEKIAILMARPMTLVSVITRPFIWLLTKTNNLILGIFGIKGGNENIVSEEEIKAMVKESADGGDVQEIEQQIVQRVFALGDRKVRELMTHRQDLIYFDIQDDGFTIKSKVQESPHSVYPVVHKNLDNLLGLVSLKEIFPVAGSEVAFDLQNYLRQPITVYENTPAYKVLEKIKEERMHYAFVVNEYGTFEGMITMDDLLDALIGSAIEDQHEEANMTEYEKGRYEMDGSYPFYKFLHHLDMEEEYEAGDYHTVAGFIINELQHFPAAGETMEWKGLLFKILHVEGVRIDKIEVTKLESD